MSNVRLIDPIDSVSLAGLKNGIPQLEDFFVFAELTGVRRTRSVITFNSTSNQTSVENIGNDVNINFIGSNYNKDSNSFNKFSTSWTDSTSNTTDNEGFGMTNIDVSINSSYIPKVTIEFTDIRGYAFLNQGVSSPYSLLFDFPPPLFKLTLKGFYGKALEYDLHLVKTNTSFKSDTGNFVITVDFIARTFAPLTDIPFNYLQVFGIMNNSTEELEEETQSGETVDTNAINLSNRKKPRNTYELIKKIGRLYTNIIELKESSEEQQKLDESRKNLNSANSSVSELNFFDRAISREFANSTQIFSINQSTENDFPIKRDFREVSDYNQILLAEGTSTAKTDIPERLCLGIETNRNNGLIGNNFDIIPNLDGVGLRAETTLLSFIERYRTTDRPIIIDGGDFQIIDVEYVDEQTGQNIIYKALDITRLYINLFNFINAKIDDVDTNQTELGNRINESVVETLGMTPTIYNIFEIICDDVDLFFNTLRNTSVSAEQHHDKYNSLINTDPSVKETRTISAFPLYINRSTTKCVTSETRSIPTVLSNKILEAGGEEFPEINLVNRFVETFIRQRLDELSEDLRTQEDADGNNKWIPFSPIDSSLINGSYSSPYTDIQNIYPNVTELQNKLYSKILERFYGISQFAYALDFYGEGDKIKKYGGTTTLLRSDLIKYLAGAEASNIAESLTNDVLIDKTIYEASIYNGNFNGFLEYIQANIPLAETVNPTAIAINEYDGVLVDVRTTDSSVNFLYKDRLNEAYNGFSILENPPQLRNETDAGDGIVDEFITNNIENNLSFINKLIYNTFDFLPSSNFAINQFTSENIIYFSDSSNSRNEGRLNPFINKLLRTSRADVYPSVEYYTKFASVPIGVLENENEKDIGSGNLTLSLSAYLSVYPEDTKNILNDVAFSNTAKAFVLVSLFGTARSFFSNAKLGNTQILNSYFQYPALIEVPYFSLLYMGAMCNIQLDENLKNEIDAIYEKYDSLNIFSSNRKNYSEDIILFNEFNEFSKTKLLEQWNRFINSTNNGERSFNRIKSYIDKLLLNINPQVDIIARYRDITNGLQGKYKKNIVDIFIKKFIVANYNQYTFSRDNVSNTQYQSIAQLSTNESNLQKHNIFFNEFFRVLETKLKERKEEVEQITQNLSEGIDDNDIKTRLYYSFKSISDKWLAGNDNKKGIGFPFNRSVGDRLIDKFAFVDRAMNPIGDDCIIGVDDLIEMGKDYDISVFTVISRLLAQNGFEFFPLQNFMSFRDNDWRDTFRTYKTVNQPATPAFVCMYIGGTSSNLQTQNGFDDDGIRDFEEEPIDFNGRDCGDDNQATKPQEIIDKEGQPVSFPYGEVRAFRVRYSEQNQSFFMNIDLDSREYNETNESLAILSKIANDKSTTVPVPKGQNLFSTYENRAYTVKVTMLGNMMIQPTQYFQLENIPLYSGVYIVLDVSHNLNEDNFMVTTFQGVRVLKYPNPIVRDFATRVGIRSGTAQDTSGSRPSRNEVESSPLYENARKVAISSTRTIDSSELETWEQYTTDKINLLHPRIRPLIRQFINGLDNELGIKLRINSGLRTIAEQIDLVEKRNRGESPFPAAPPYRSFHNYGLAIDVQYYDQEKKQFVNSANHNRWPEIGGYAEGLGLRWGIDFPTPDIIHFDMTYGFTSFELEAKYKAGDRVGEYVNLK